MGKNQDDKATVAQKATQTKDKVKAGIEDLIEKFIRTFGSSYQILGLEIDKLCQKHGTSKEEAMAFKKEAKAELRKRVDTFVDNREKLQTSIKSIPDTSFMQNTIRAELHYAPNVAYDYEKKIKESAKNK